MDKLFTVCLELTFRDVNHKLYTTTIDYCSPNQNLTILSIVCESQFVIAVDKAQEQAGFPYNCFLVGVRDIDKSLE